MMFSADRFISLFDALQLVALAPCVFVILFLLTRLHRAEVVIPCLYFAALGSTFVLPLLPERQNGVMALYAALIFVQTLLPALSFLLIMQFALRCVPPVFYWLVLALPLLGGSGIVYASLLAEEICLSEVGCIELSAAVGVYGLLGNGFIFLLLVVVYARLRETPRNARLRTQDRNRYWLIVALIALNLLVMLVDLLHLSAVMNEADAGVVIALLRLSFIYVVLTLLFRVFDRQAEEGEDAQEEAQRLHLREEKDRRILAAFTALMEERQFYREMQCSRETLARELGVGENTLSRIINHHFGQRLTDVVNQYRVKEAQRLLLAHPQQAVTDIAFEVGFNSIPSFNRVFKEGCGFSPTEYRNTHLHGRKR